jgi:subtilase family serine protease
VLEAVVDSQDDIMEADEENNLAELEVFVRERLPEEIEGEDFVDLMVLNAKLSTVDVIVGEEVTVTASILNSGNIPSAGFTVGLYANSIFNEVLDETTVDLLAPLDSVEVSLTLDTLELADESEIIVFADNARIIVEADEENNTDSVVIHLTGEEMTVYFESGLLVNEKQVFTATDVAGKGLAGATVKIVYPFENRIRTESVVTDVAGIAEFTVTTPGTYSFTVSKPGYHPFFGEFSVTGEAIALPVGFEFDMNLIYLVILIIIIAGVAYYMLVLRKK